MSTESSGDMGKMVAFVRGIPGVAHTEQVKQACLFVFCTSGGRSPARTEKMVARVLEPLGLAVPARQTIAEWANEENWHRHANDVWRHNSGQVMVDTQAAGVAALAASMQNMADLATGVDQRPIEERMVTIAAHKVIVQAARDLPGLTRVTPPEDVTDSAAKDRDEGEAQAKSAMIQRGKTG